MPTSKKSYAIASYFPAVYDIDTAIFQFYGGSFTKEEKEDYIIWFLSQSRVCCDEINTDATLEDCEKQKKKSVYIDWNTCSRGYLTQMKKCEVI